MIRLLVALIVSLGALLYVQIAHAGKFLPHRKGMSVEAKVEYFKRSLRHEWQVIAFLEGRHAPRTLERVTQIRWYRAAVRWHTRLLAQYNAKLEPKLPDLRTYAGTCLAAIIDHEGSGWNPRKWNTSGSGAYGLPQALPASKMRSAGSDWQTNPYTQIRWMRSYVSRYGGACAALAFWERNHWY